jgi:hypothetical protein
MKSINRTNVLVRLTKCLDLREKKLQAQSATAPGHVAGTKGEAVKNTGMFMNMNRPIVHRMIRQRDLRSFRVIQKEACSSSDEANGKGEPNLATYATQ